MLWLLSTEILLKQIDLIVLSDAFLGTCHEVLGGLTESKVGVSVEFLGIFRYISILSVVVVLRPTYLKLFHKFGSCIMMTYLQLHASFLCC